MDEFVSSDAALLDLLRKQSPQTVSQLAETMGVTATAVRQRLSRLLGQGLIQRDSSAAANGRGRPSHHYRLTDRGRRRTGANFADLALVLWQELREVKDPELRRGLLKRIARRMADQYSDEVTGATVEQRMKSLAELFSRRQVPFEVEQDSSGLPILNALACPYPELAEQDRGICAMERLMFEEVLGEEIRLSSCRLDGGGCCEFEPRGPLTDTPITPAGS